MFLFASFEPGTLIGQREMALDPSLVAHWRKLFPDDQTGDFMPAGMVAIVTSRAYSEVLHPRPAGNVHGAQRFTLLRLPRLGERLTTAVRCAAKEMKGSRRWVQFATTTTDAQGAACFEGHQAVLWAE
ncbi:MAG: hypothetical protein NVS2B11_06100 [Acetobacteraceae bacterium]